jgi:SAM-dependent methyltransferase
MSPDSNGDGPTPQHRRQAESAPSLSGFDARFASLAASPTVRQLFQEGLGRDLPAAVEPFSFVPLTGLQTIAETLNLRPNQRLVDLGCGRGGPGLWIASARDTHLVGVDSSRLAIDHARARTHHFLPAGHASFLLGDLTSSGLADGCADGLVCIDAFHMADPGRTANEIARLLAPGALAAITSWESLHVARYPASIAEHLAAAGLHTLTSQHQPAWLNRQLRIYATALEVAQTSNDPAVAALAREARRFTAYTHSISRVLVVARSASAPRGVSE